MGNNYGDKNLSIVKDNGINLTPEVDDMVKVERYIGPNQTQIYYNPTVNELYRPIQGVKTPWSESSIIPGQRNILTGYVEDTFVNDISFNEQLYNFQNFGQALHPNSREITITNNNEEKVEEGKEKVRNKRKRKRGGVRPSYKDPKNIEEFMGPWYDPNARPKENTNISNDKKDIDNENNTNNQEDVQKVEENENNNKKNDVENENEEKVEEGKKVQ